MAVLAVVSFHAAQVSQAGITVILTNSSPHAVHAAFYGSALDVSETNATLAAGASRSFDLKSISNGRIYISQEEALDFGGGEPDGANVADANFRKRFDKVELTYTPGQWAGGNANLTAVDFYGIPLLLETKIGDVVIEHFTLTTNQTGLAVQNAIHNILAGTNASRAIVTNASGGFVRLLSPVKAPAAYRSQDGYLDAVADATFDISGFYYGIPATNYHFTGATQSDRIVLNSGTNQMVIHRDTLRYDADDAILHNGIYTCNAPYEVNGEESNVAHNDVFAAVYRDLVSAFNLGLVTSGANHSTNWWARAPFPQDGQFRYNEYAKVIADHYAGAYGFPFSDTVSHVLTSLGGQISTLKITVLGDSVVVPPVTRAGNRNPQDGSVRFKMNLFARGSIKDVDFEFNGHPFAGGHSYLFPSQRTQWGQDEFHALIENIPAQPGLNIYDLSFGKNKYQILVLVTNGAVSMASAAGGADANWDSPVLFVGGVNPGPVGLVGAAGGDPTDGWSEYARYGDFLSSQMKSLRKFGYGMFVAKMQAADGPTCSTFWLYADAPAPGCMPEIAQLWRWNEFDFEFVPYTRAHQNSYITLDGEFPTPDVRYFGSLLNIDGMPNGDITSNHVSWVENRFMTDDVVMGDMQRYYNRWMVNYHDPAVLISTNDHTYAGVVRTTGPGHEIGGNTNNPGHLPGWHLAEVWKYPLTAVKPPPDTCDMRRMTAINWWRMPSGNQSMSVVMPGINTQKYDFVVKQNVLAGSTAPESYTRAAMNNETYVFPSTNSTFHPYTNLNTYTIVWSKSRVAFYINAGQDGTDISGATPIAVHELADYPSMADAGTQAPQGKIPWVDTSLADPLGEVSINLANYVAFKPAMIKSNSLLTAEEKASEGWSGYPPGPAWPGADALVRSVKYYPLVSEDSVGDSHSHFHFASTNAWIFDLGDGTWNATNFHARLSRYFGILYAQDFTQDGIAGTNLRDAKSPLAVEFDANAGGALAADGLPLMKLLCKSSVDAPKRNFFRLGTTMNTGAPIGESNPFMFATIDVGGGEMGISGASTPLAFFAPLEGQGQVATVKLYLSSTYHGSFPSNAIPTIPAATATLLLTNNLEDGISWSSLSDPNGILTEFQSQNPHLITVRRGSDHLPAMLASPYQEDGYLKTNSALWWHPAEVFNEGVSIVGYHIQISATESFASPLVDVTNQVPTLTLPFLHGGPLIFGILLGDLEGMENLQPQTEYAWRIRAEDSNGGLSDWMEGSFHFGVLPPTVSGFAPSESAGWQLTWDGESENYEVQFRTNLMDEAGWQPVADSLSGQSLSIAPTNAHAGYYRVVAR